MLCSGFREVRRDGADAILLADDLTMKKWEVISANMTDDMLRIIEFEACGNGNSSAYSNIADDFEELKDFKETSINTKTGRITVKNVFGDNDNSMTSNTLSQLAIAISCQVQSVFDKNIADMTIVKKTTRRMNKNGGGGGVSGSEGGTKGRVKPQKIEY